MNQIYIYVQSIERRKVSRTASSFLWSEIENTLVKSGDEPEYLAHFTSIDGLFGILSKCQIFASHFAFMNDPEDCVLLRDSMIKYLIEYEKGRSNLFSDVLEMLYRKDDIIIFDDLPCKESHSPDYEIFILFMSLFNMKHFMNNIFEFSSGHYLLSFASGDDFDRLSNWRSYGADGRGAALIFSGRTLISSIRDGRSELESNIFNENISQSHFNEKVTESEFVKCLYWSDAEIENFCREFILKFVNDVQSNNYEGDIYSYVDRLSLGLSKLGTRVKNSHYCDENEYRLIFHDNGIGCEKKLEYRRSGNIILPYINIEWGLRSLKKIIRGPKTNPRLKSSVDHILREKYWRLFGAIHMVQNDFSKIPYVDNT